MTWRRRRTPQPEVPTPSQPYQLDEESLFAFLEDCLTGTWVSGPAPDQLDRRVFELVNDDWSEQEATRELVRLAGQDHVALRILHRRLQAGLLGNPWVDVASVRASRVVLAAARQVAGR